MIWSSIMNNKATKVVLLKYKGNNNDISMNYQIEDNNDKDCSLVDDKRKKRPSEATEELKNIKPPKNHN